MLAAALSLTNCTKNEEATFTPEVKVPFELYANMDDTRTTNNGLSTKWETEDAINVFHAVADATVDYVNDGKFTTDNGDGKFKGTLAAELEAGTSYDWYACYPYKSFMTSPNNTSESWLYVGSRSDEAQTQIGNNSKAHIAGSNYPLYGVAEDVAASETPSITMSHASSLVEFNVTNTLDEAITVNSIVFTVDGNDEKIVGNFYMAIHSGKPTFTDYTYTSNVATLNVADGEAIAAGESAKFYMGIKPFVANDYALTVAINATSASGKGTCTKELPVVSTTFAPGKIKTLNVGFDAKIEAESGLPLPFNEPFEANQGKFTIKDVDISSLTYVWKYDQDYTCMKASAYASGQRYATESWLVSPLIAIPETITYAPVLSFDHAINYASGTQPLALKVKASAEDEWKAFDIPNKASGSDFNFVNSGDIDLSEYKGKNIQFAFVYTSSTSIAATVEVKNVKVEDRKITPILKFATGLLNFAIGDTFEGQQVTGAKTAVTYTSNNTDVATVNASTGAVTLGSTAGSAVITATAAAEGIYNSSSATYTIVIKDSAITTTDVTISFANTTQRTSQDSNKQVWTNSGVTFTNDKATSSTAVANYSNPVRLYQNSSITITAPGNITSIKFVANSSTYATALKNSIGSSASASGSNVVVTLNGSSDTFTVAKLTAQVRLNSLTVTYVTGGKVKENQTLSFDQSNIDITLGEQTTFTGQQVKGAQTTVTYSSSNTAVATVNTTTGDVTIVGAGVTAITATAASSDDYHEAKAEYTITVTNPNAGPADDHKGNITLTTDGGNKTSDALVKINGKEYKAIKAGTGDVAGSCVVKVPAGTTKLHLHMAAWKGEASNKIAVKNGSTTIKTLSLIADNGVSGNSTFTIQSTDLSKLYHVVELSGITADTQLTLEVTGGNRFVVWGVTAN